MMTLKSQQASYDRNGSRQVTQTKNGTDDAKCKHVAATNLLVRIHKKDTWKWRKGREGICPILPYSIPSVTPFVLSIGQGRQLSRKKGLLELQ